MSVTIRRLRPFVFCLLHSPWTASFGRADRLAIDHGCHRIRLTLLRRPYRRYQHVIEKIKQPVVAMHWIVFARTTDFAYRLQKRRDHSPFIVNVVACIALASSGMLRRAVLSTPSDLSNSK